MLYVVVVDRPVLPYTEFPLAVRLEWVRKISTGIGKNIQVRALVPPESWPDVDDERWAAATVNAIGEAPQAHFTFEQVRDAGYAKAMGAVMVVPYSTPPIRASMIRQNPELYRSYVIPEVAAWLEEHQVTRPHRDMNDSVPLR